MLSLLLVTVHPLWAEVTPKWAIEGLRAALKDPSPGVQQIARVRLAERKVPECMDQIDRLLDDPDENHRRSALEAFAHFGPTAAPYASHIASMLDAPEPYVRVYAIQALGSLGEASSPYVPQMIGFLKPLDQHFRESQAAAHALGKLGASSREVVDAVSKLMEAKDPEIRAGALIALGESGANGRPYMQAVVQGLSDPIAKVRAGSVQALGQLDKPASVHGTQIAVLLKDPDPAVRQAAAQSLGNLGESVRQYEPQLAESLTDSNADVRRAAAEAISRIGPSSVSIAERVTLLLSSATGGPDELAREAWIRTGDDRRRFVLQQFEKLVQTPSLPPNVPAEYQSQHERITRIIVLSGLHKMGEAAREAVPDIAKYLDAPSTYTRSMALVALGTIGKYAHEAQPKIIKQLDDSDARIRRNALYALNELGDLPVEDEAIVRKMLADPDELTRRAAARVIEENSQIKDRLDQIIAQGKSKDADQRREAVEAIKRIHDKGQAASKIATLISSPDPQVSACAIWALGEGGEQALDYVSRFSDKEKDPDEGVRRAVRDALDKIGKASQDRAPELADDLIQSEGNSNAHETLRAMGPYAASALPKLAPLLDSQEFILSSLFRENYGCHWSCGTPL